MKFVEPWFAVLLQRSASSSVMLPFLEALLKVCRAEIIQPFTPLYGLVEDILRLVKLL